MRIVFFYFIFLTEVIKPSASPALPYIRRALAVVKQLSPAVVIEPQQSRWQLIPKEMEPGGTSGSPEAPVQVKVVQVPAKCLGGTAVQPSTSAEGAPKVDQAVAKVVPAVRSQQPASSTVSLSGLQASPSVVVITKVAAPGTNRQPQLRKAVLSQVAPLYQGPTPVRTVMITVPTPAAAHTATVSHRMPASTSQSPQLPTNIHIPPGMMLIRSDSGQMMLVSQQALAQVQQPQRGVGGQSPRVVAQQVPAATGNKSIEKLSVIRMAAPPTFQPAPGQKTSIVKVIRVASKPSVVQSFVAVADQGSQLPRLQAAVPEAAVEPPTTFSQETLESVKKCKNFLVTLIKLASSDSRTPNMANNVRGLVKSLLEGKIEAEEFTQQLYNELKSTPQPCLVPFLKKSLPAVRQLIADPKSFVQQASTSVCKTGTDARQNLNTSQQVSQKPLEVPVRAGFTTLEQSRDPRAGKPHSKYAGFPSGKPSAELLRAHLQAGRQLMLNRTLPIQQPFHQDSTQPTKLAFKYSGSYKEDDDINDVAFMAGVNLREENAQILTTKVGSVVQSCQDQLFLSPNPVLRRILRAGQAMGVTEVGPEVVALVSHATQEYIRGLTEKLTVMALHRRTSLEGDARHEKTSDVRSQLRFFGEVESLKKKRQDEEERERMMRLARSRSHSEDPQHQQLRQRAKELQQLEEAQLQQREANLTALAAIGPRKKRPLEHSESQVTLLPRQGVQRVTRIMLRDLLACMEQDHFLRCSLTLYRAML
ncbi:transcription initiation factor TFIID subunit 4-like [Nelusetta ayraudi]|uniref:transcription initiation factor TFIID subunit 4-like n=1 Tax=Nelusetta ayraudi TaxID=303726 RepID=UPI003F705AB4